MFARWGGLCIQALTILRGDPFPRVLPGVDLNNLVSLRLLLPCCILRADAVLEDVTLRAGAEGEEMESLRGPFRLGGKPLLADARGPFSTPITDSRRVALAAADREALLVVYAAEEHVLAADLSRAIEDLARATGVAEVEEMSRSLAPR